MSDTKYHTSGDGEFLHPPRIYSPNLQPLIQSILSTLANIDYEYEAEKNKISTRTADINLKIKVLEKLKARHHERREPYIVQLSILQKGMLRTEEPA